MYNLLNRSFNMTHFSCNNAIQIGKEILKIRMVWIVITILVTNFPLNISFLKSRISQSLNKLKMVFHICLKCVLQILKQLLSIYPSIKTAWWEKIFSLLFSKKSSDSLFEALNWVTKHFSFLNIPTPQREVLSSFKISRMGFTPISLSA